MAKNGHRSGSRIGGCGVRYSVKTDRGYGVWDAYLLQWVEPEMGTADSLTEVDAENLLASLTG